MVGRFEVSKTAQLTALALGLSRVLACAPDEARRDCAAQCERIARCGLLPGPLGTEEANCVARCRSTEEESLEVLARCHDAAEEASPAEECPARVEAQLGCEAYAACLRSEYRDDAIVGRAVVEVDLFGAEMSGLPTAQACEAEPTGDAACVANPESSQDCENGVIRWAADAWCQQTGTVEIEYFVEQNGVQRSVVGPCGALARGATIDDGTLLPGAPVEVMASFRTAPVGSMNVRCASSHGTKLSVRAGRNTLLVPVPSAVLGTPGAWLGSCEHGTSCFDGLDNDLDGLVDCQDSECIPGCVAGETGETEG